MKTIIDRKYCLTGASILRGTMQVHDKHEELGRSVLRFGRLQHALGQAIFLQRAVKDLYGVPKPLSSDIEGSVAFPS